MDQGTNYLLPSPQINQEIVEQDAVEIKISLEDAKILPPEFFNIADKIHKNYLYWKSLRDSAKTTQLTFYRYIQEGIAQGAEQVSQTEISIEPDVLLMLETRITLTTMNSLVLAATEYFEKGYLQDSKDSIDTALSTLY